ncbi:LysR family transcriptional regulator [Streptomyces sp. NPDC096013]|uniref:helix-turn-helix domain-containing protein n=1 Tax=Streptomyces sp. NPDC096013 TaxID=3366069 RepID=UPI00382CEA78
MLNLVHLRVLAAVARHGSVTEAARELHHSQPSVSHHVSRLEPANQVGLEAGRVGLAANASTLSTIAPTRPSRLRGSARTHRR